VLAITDLPDFSIDAKKKKKRKKEKQKKMNWVECLGFQPIQCVKSSVVWVQ
jgi:hypothetical protein